MANSSFQKGKSITIPVKVPNGGTGKTSLDSKSVVVGTGIGEVGFIAPGVSDNILVSDGESWKSGVFIPADASVSYVKLGADLSNSAVISSVDIDWSTSSIFTKTITSNTVFTFSNYQLNKIITLVIKGNYVISLPKSVSTITGLYDGLTTNYITLHCIKITAPQEVWAVINKKYYNIPAGYFSGGDTASGGRVTTTDKILFSTGVTSVSTVSNLSQTKVMHAAISDKNYYGYFAGGEIVAATDRIVFSTGVNSANTVSNLPTIRGSAGTVSDGSNYGYVSGGTTGAVVATTERLTFSTGIFSSNTVSNLSLVRSGLSGLSDSVAYGYFSGGDTNRLGAFTALTDRIVFSTGATSSNTVSNITQAKYAFAGISDSSTYGYFAGGFSSTYTNIANRIVFSTGITSLNTVSNLSQARHSLASSSDSASYGYFSAGSTGSSLYVTLSDRIVFSTGVTTANTVSNLSQARGYLSGLSNCSV